MTEPSPYTFPVPVPAPVQDPDADATRERAMAASWRANAQRWTDAVRGGRIASRRLVTDRAVVEAVLARRPRRVLDLGCGEGWLARALAARLPGAEVVGVDAAPELIERARRGLALAGATGHGHAYAPAHGRPPHAACDFQQATYAELVDDPHRLGRFEVVVANFALLDRDLEPLLAALARRLAPGGAVIVQTVHPMNVPAPYADGWREETFAGFGDGGADEHGGDAGAWTPMPWYFRTLGSWLTTMAGVLRVVRVAEPLHPETGRPLSLLITATAAAG